MGFGNTSAGGVEGRRGKELTCCEIWEMPAWGSAWMNGSVPTESVLPGDGGLDETASRNF